MIIGSPTMGDDVQVKEEEGMSPPRGRSRSRSRSRSPRRRSYSPDRRRRRDRGIVRGRGRGGGEGPGLALGLDRPAATAAGRARTRGPDPGRDRRRADADDRRRAENGIRVVRRPAVPRVKAEAEEAIPCVGYEGRIIGRGGETIRRIQQETGARISIDRASGECVVSGSTEQVILGSAAVKNIMPRRGSGAAAAAVTAAAAAGSGPRAGRSKPRRRSRAPGRREGSSARGRDHPPAAGGNRMQD